METITPEEFKRRYGEVGLKQVKTTSAKASLFSNVGSDLMQRGRNIKEAYLKSSKGFESEINPARAGVRVAGELAGGLGDIGTQALRSVGEATGITENVIKPVSTAILNTTIGKKGLEAVQGGMEVYNAFKERNPEVAEDLEAVLNIGALFPVGKAGQAVGKTTVNAGKKTVEGFIDTMGRVSDKVVDVAESGVSKVLDPERVMQRVARIPKGAQIKFEKIAGESVGAYLNKRNIYGDPEDISRQLYERFSASKIAADEALEKLPWVYKDVKPAETALDDLLLREARVSTTGAPSPNLNRVQFLWNKYKSSGLNMSEINEVKRLYEKNIRLDFVKQNLPEGVARATNIDNALRNWQFQEAQRHGLKNLPDINKETRLAKELLDAVGKEYAGVAGNNAVSLTDWIALSGGDLSSVALYLTKRATTSKKIQSAIAKKVYSGEKIGLPKGEFEQTTVKSLPAPSSKIRSQTGSKKPIRVPEKGKNIEIIDR